jgi:cysteine desulfurase
MAVSAHKFGGPKGIGALLVKKGLDLPPLLSGRQERHRRGGTENLPGIVGFATACAQRASSLGEDLARMRTLRDRLQQGLLDLLPGIHVHGRDGERLPNTLSLRLAAIDAERVLNALDAAGIHASSGAACSAGGNQPSHVLLAMGQTVAQARAGIRFSLGFETTSAEIDRCIAAAARVLAPLLAESRELASATA